MQLALGAATASRLQPLWAKVGLDRLGTLHLAVTSPACCPLGRRQNCLHFQLSPQLLGLQMGRRFYVGSCLGQHRLCCFSICSGKVEEPEAIPGPCRTSSLPGWSLVVASVESCG